MSMDQATDGIRCCAVIPAFNEGGRIGATVKGVLGYCPWVLVVDDGSADATAAEAEAAGAQVLRHVKNQGKGASLDDGIRQAVNQGTEVILTMDGDGQHAPEDIPAFLDAYRRTGVGVLVGNRMADPRTMPLVRRLTNRFMSWLLSRQMGQRVPDTQCGYRLYRADVIGGVSLKSGGFAAESEVLLVLAERGVRMGAVPIRVIYGDEKSKIRPIRDTLRFFKMLRAHRLDKSTSQPIH